MPIDLDPVRSTRWWGARSTACPSELARLVDNVVVLVESEAPDDDPDLLGLYDGLALTERPANHAGMLPDRILLFRGPLLDMADTRRGPRGGGPDHRRARGRPPLRARRRAAARPGLGLPAAPLRAPCPSCQPSRHARPPARPSPRRTAPRRRRTLHRLHREGRERREATAEAGAEQRPSRVAEGEGGEDAEQARSHVLTSSMPVGPPTVERPAEDVAQRRAHSGAEGDEQGRHARRPVGSGSARQVPAERRGAQAGRERRRDERPAWAT